MDRKRFKPDSEFVLNKCGTRVYDGVDRISALPDEIIVVILSFLSLREAAATSVLSSRWLDLWKHTPNPKSDRLSRLPHSVIVDILSLLPLKTAAATSVLCSRWPHLWKHTPNLSFTICLFKFNLQTMWNMDAAGLWNAKRCKYVKLVKSVIQSHKAPSLKQFTISFYVNKAAKRVVAKWLEFAFSRGVERLVLDLYSKMPRYEVVLEEVLRERGLCSSPKKLILFKSLKSLCIKHVNVSGEAVKIFLRNCPLLEELIIADSNMTSPVEVRGSTLVLKHLEVCNSYVDNYFVVSAPNLTRLKFTVHFLKLFLGRVPKLVEAEVLYENKVMHPALNVASESALSRLSSQLEILNLSLNYPKVFLANEFPEMPKLRKLVVEYHGLKTHSLLPVTPLLWACPRLEEFKLVYKDATENQNFRNGDEATEVRGIGESSGHLHLKLFELEGLVDGADGHIELVNYIFDNCIALEKIQISVAGERSPPDGPIIKNHEQAAGDYTRQRLQGKLKLPRHIQLQIS